MNCDPINLDAVLAALDLQENIFLAAAEWLAPEEGEALNCPRLAELMGVVVHYDIVLALPEDSLLHLILKDCFEADHPVWKFVEIVDNPITQVDG